MKHLGDITKINAHNVPIVDIVTGGSPCQDLSVAGHRKGMKHTELGNKENTRSGLFMEQIRIIREMRDECIKELQMRGTNEPIRPRFMCWENVAGALSSGKPRGEDFRIVLEQIAKIADENAIIPRFEGGWASSGCILADGWSIAWRVHDAQFWGVPQRRRRVALVADFNGQTAPEILFERKSVQGVIKHDGEKREENPRRGKKGIGATVYTVGHDVRSARLTEDGITDPLTASDYKDPMKLFTDSVARRLMPIECERLQAFPDDWTNIGEWTDSKGKTHKDADSPRYKAIGNSIALPFFEWMAKRMVEHLEIDNPTMASLFDGIGGFPLVFSRVGCKPIWASEVEEFPIAVTKIRFPEESE